MSQDQWNPISGTEVWHRWSPRVAEDESLVHVAHAVAAFEPVDNPAGRESAAWLKNEALQHFPSVITHIALKDGLVQGFYAIKGAEVRLSQRERRRLLRSGAESVAAFQPASLITRVGLHRDATLPFRYVLLHAVSTAVQVRELQGNIALLLDPFDSDVAQRLQREYGFRIAYADDSASTPRLWLPLPESDQA
jgi:hypothetical protein